MYFFNVIIFIMKKVKENNNKNISKLIKLSEEAGLLVGAPYKYGAYAQKPKGTETSFDCSSLVQYVYKRVGVRLPRSSIFQATKGVKVKDKKFTLGDLLFFRSDRGHYYDELFSGEKIYIGHVAVYLSDNLIIHAKSSKGVVLQKLSDLQKDKNYKIVLAKRILEISYFGGFKLTSFSQFLDIKEKKWQNKSCGVVSFSMLVNFLADKKAVKPNEVLKKVLEFEGAYIEKIGWTHKTFVGGAKSFGFSAKAYDFFEKTDDFAFGKLLKFLEKAPVMVSIYKDLNPKNSGHLVVVSGIKNGKVQYYDPDSKIRKEVKREIDIYSFIKGWKRRFIVIKSK